MNVMEWIQTLLISGLCIPSFCADYRQHCLVETPKSWIDAQSYCRERGHDLATIDNMGTVESVLPTIEGKADEWWIGFHWAGPKRWHWSLADNDFYQEGEREYRNFKFPNQNGPFVSHENGVWLSSTQANLWFICYDGNKQGGDRYVLVQHVMSWTEAQTYCRSRHTDLVSIRNAAEDQAVADVVLNWNIMIGLFKDAWIWSDNRNSSFRHWIEDSFEKAHDSSCAVMNSKHSGRWKQVSCGELRPFICTCTRKWVFKVKVHSEDIQDLNDPAIKASISKQTQQLLNEATLSNYHSMTWNTNSEGQVFTKEQCLEEDCNV